MADDDIPRKPEPDRRPGDPAGQPRRPAWRPTDFSELESRLTEAKALLEQAARMMEASEMRKVTTLADLALDEARAAHDHAIPRRYR